MKNTVKNLWDLQVAASPDALALIDGGRRLTFAQLDAMANDFAARFPVSHPRFVGIVTDHSAEMIAAILAVLKTGGAYVPCEPTFPPERTHNMMTEANVDFIITNPRYAERFGPIPRLELEVPSDFTDDIPAPHTEVEPSDPAYVLYTSGTTGKPKGVVVTNANICHYVRAFSAEFHPAPGDRMLQLSVCSFDIFVEEVFTTLLNGAALVIAPEEVKGDIAKLTAFCEANGVTEISGFPYLLVEFNKTGILPRGLRLLISGGDVLRASYIDRIRDKGVLIYNTYGPSETTVCATYQRCDNCAPLYDGTFPIGHEVKGTQIEIVDSELNPVPDGVKGEICIFGGGVSDGYLVANPESSNFRTAPDGRRMYLSGDLGYRLPDGSIAFLRRKDTQIMILGKRVECEEVENVLNECHGVERAVVKAYADSHSLNYMVAYVVPEDAATFSLAEVRQEMARNLAPFMIPEFFVRMNEIPLNANGKVDSARLPVVMKEYAL